MLGLGQLQCTCKPYTIALLDMQVAVAFCTLTGEHVIDNSLGDQLNSYVWDLQDPNTPEHVLMPSSPVLSLHFSPKDSKVMLDSLKASVEDETWVPIQSFSIDHCNEAEVKIFCKKYVRLSCTITPSW